MNAVAAANFVAAVNAANAVNAVKSVNFHTYDLLWQVDTGL